MTRRWAVYRSVEYRSLAAVTDMTSKEWPRVREYYQRRFEPTGGLEDLVDAQRGAWHQDLGRAMMFSDLAEATACALRNDGGVEEVELRPPATRALDPGGQVRMNFSDWKVVDEVGRVWDYEANQGRR